MLTIEQLQQRINDGIPLATHMDFRLCELQPNAIQVTAGGRQNVNIHGTAFAGSLYSVCTLALWALVTARLPANADLVLAKGNISYRQPVVGEIFACCQIDESQLQTFLSDLHKQGKARLNAAVDVPGREGVAAHYTATVHASLQNLARHSITQTERAT